MPALGFKYNRKGALATLKPKQVRRARRDYALGLATQKQLSERLGISQPAVSMIMRGVTYRWCGLFNRSTESEAA